METSFPVNRVTGVFLSCSMYSFNTAENMEPPLVLRVNSARLFWMVISESTPWRALKKSAVESTVSTSFSFANAASALAFSASSRCCTSAMES